MKKIKCSRIIQNSVVGIIASILSTLSIYIVRIVISRILGDEIYGVNSIFISIVNAFLILEMGMSTAMIITMYKPVADDDQEKIRSILKFYKNFYRLFCAVLIALGIVVDIFFLKKFVKTNLNFYDVQLYFLLYLFSVVFKYLWSYKSCLLYANRQNSVISLSTIIVTIVFTILEILGIICFKDYRIYLLLFVLQNIAINVICNTYANKKYPFIKQKDAALLSSESKAQLIKIIRPMFVQRLANQLQDASSVIILGLLGIGAAIVGYFSNYVWVVHACQTIFTQIGSAFTTSFGSFYVKNDNIKNTVLYYEKARFFMSWISVVFSTLYLCLIQSFVSLFFGTAYCLTDSIAIVFSIYVFVLLNSSINLSVQNAVGAHYLDTKWMIIQAITSIILSVVLGMLWGELGVIIGMLLPITLFTGILKGSKVYENVFFEKRSRHLVLLLRECLNFLVVSISSYLIYTLLLKPQKMLHFVFSAMVIAIVSNVEMLLLNFNSKHLIDIKSKIRVKIKGVYK